MVLLRNALHTLFSQWTCGTTMVCETSMFFINEVNEVQMWQQCARRPLADDVSCRKVNDITQCSHHCSLYARCRDNRVHLTSSLVLCLSLYLHIVNEAKFHPYTVQRWRCARGVRNLKQLVRCYSAIPPPKDPSSLVASHLLNILRTFELVTQVDGRGQWYFFNHSCLPLIGWYLRLANTHLRRSMMSGSFPSNKYVTQFPVCRFKPGPLQLQNVSLFRIRSAGYQLASGSFVLCTITVVACDSHANVLFAYQHSKYKQC